MRVWCPKECKDKTEFNVWGSKNNYADESSICRAAIHSGVIKDSEGGTFVISYNEDCHEYIGLDQNDVKSKTIVSDDEVKSKGGKVFHTYKVKDNCPNVKYGFASFLEENFTVKLKVPKNK